MSSREKALLVGDNPFHGISHLSQERSRIRGDTLTSPEYAAKLVSIAVENGANGFMFSVSNTTLSILKILNEDGVVEHLDLYGIVPYAYEYVRMASQRGGVPGLAKTVAKEILFSGNFGAVFSGLNGVLRAKPISLMEAYLAYEISRIKAAAGKNARLSCVLLHQLVTDVCLGFNLDWLFRAYVDFMLDKGIKPGFNTGNFTFLVEKFREWGINLEEVVIAAPFNKIGFQMVPSKEKCEEALAAMPKPNVVAISIMAAGYLKPMEAIEYIAKLLNVKGVAVGVSREMHAIETFGLIKNMLLKE
jgi:uncharacterized protein (DUF486 family)